MKAEVTNKQKKTFQKFEVSEGNVLKKVFSEEPTSRQDKMAVRNTECLCSTLFFSFFILLQLEKGVDLKPK